MHPKAAPKCATSGPTRVSLWWTRASPLEPSASSAFRRAAGVRARPRRPRNVSGGPEPASTETSRRGERSLSRFERPTRPPPGICRRGPLVSRHFARGHRSRPAGTLARRVRCDRASRRRDRRRQDVSRAPPPRRRRARDGAAPRHQLRRHPRDADRERALWPRAGRVHRSNDRALRGARGGEPRNRAARRDRRAAARRARRSCCACSRRSVSSAWAPIAR